MYINPPNNAAPPPANPAEAPTKTVRATVPCMYPTLYDTIDELIDVYNSLPIKARHSPSTGYVNMSCGITTLYGVRSAFPRDIVRKILVERADSDYKRIREAFVQWSDTDYQGEKGGNALAKYIQDNNIGKIVEFGPRMNPNSGNMIKMWVWEPPHESLAPKDKYMPVFGMIRVQRGDITEYQNTFGTSEVADDTRFLEDRFERGTTKA